MEEEEDSLYSLTQRLRKDIYHVDSYREFVIIRLKSDPGPEGHN